MANDRMTDNDRRLIADARSLHYQDWNEVFTSLIPQADTDRAREELKGIACSKYHTDEYYSGIQ